MWDLIFLKSMELLFTIISMSKMLTVQTLFFSTAGFQILEMRSTHWILQIVGACLLFCQAESAGKKTVYLFC